MICFRDMSFCSAKCRTTSCRRNMTDEVRAEGEAWWGSPDFPVAYMDMSKGCPDYDPAPEAEETK